MGGDSRCIGYWQHSNGEFGRLEAGNPIWGRTWGKGKPNHDVPALSDFEALQGYCLKYAKTKQECRSCFGSLKHRSNKCLVKNEKKVRCRKITNEQFCVAVGCNFAKKKSQCNGRPFSSIL